LLLKEEVILYAILILIKYHKSSAMLKNLKKKDTKTDPKKDTKKEVTQS
jgi:hypothetical protein